MKKQLCLFLLSIASVSPFLAPAAPLPAVRLNKVGMTYVIKLNPEAITPKPGASIGHGPLVRNRVPSSRKRNGPHNSMLESLFTPAVCEAGSGESGDAAGSASTKEVKSCIYRL